MTFLTFLRLHMYPCLESAIVKNLVDDHLCGLGSQHNFSQNHLAFQAYKS